MSTRSAIIVKSGDIYKGVFCHWDGYPSHNGKILQEHYNSEEKALALVSLGFIDVLGPKLSPDPGIPHNYQNRQKDTTRAIHRDCGEDLEIFSGNTVEEVENLISDFEYSYVFENGFWKVNGESLELKLQNLGKDE